MSKREKLYLTLFIILALLFLFSIPVRVAYPKDPPPHIFTKCELQNRPETALDAKTGKLIAVGPDRWFVQCFEVVATKGKQKLLNPRRLPGDLGGYGYYAQYIDAAKAAYNETHPKQEEPKQ